MVSRQQRITGQQAVGLIIALFLLLLAIPRSQAADTITVQAQVASRQVYVGQPFTLQLEINGADQVEQPEIDIPHFKVEARGGTNRSQSYQISLNGKIQTSKTLSYIYQYQLIAERPGQLTIPALPVPVGTTTYSTEPIIMMVQEPVEIEDFKLRMELSKDRCYLGEPITITTTWLIGQELKGFDLNVPLFNDSRFELYARRPTQAATSTELVELEVAGERIVAEKKVLNHGDRQYVALTFSHTLIPRSVGRLSLPGATLAINAFEGYNRTEQRQFGRDPFAMFGADRRKMYRTVVIPANPLHLEVLELPRQGRPPHFSGLVGHYTISNEASPTSVNVGDPISLTVGISGTFVDNISLPALKNSLPEQDFRVATDTPQSTLTNNSKTFTTTIRASHDHVEKIPGLSLPFFNPETRSYQVAHSEEIRLTVHPTRIVTAQDALGTDAAMPAAAPAAIPAPARQDIRPNYEEIDLALPPGYSRIFLLALLVLPPLLAGLVVFVDIYRHDDTRESRHRRRQAYRRLRKRLHRCGEEEFFDAWLTFLGDKLGRPARSITQADVLSRLAGQHTEAALAGEIAEIFRQGEAALYGGLGHVLDRENILKVAKKIVKVL